MRREHECGGHANYRSWCSHCVAGRGRSRKHQKIERGHGDELAVVGLDYGFLGPKCRKCDEDDPDVLLTYVGMKDRPSKAIAAITVPEKGIAGGYTAKRIDEQLTEWGHGPVCLRSDGEKAIVAVKTEVKRLRGQETTIPETSPTGDHAANGEAEQAVQTIAGIFRANKRALEEKVGRRIGSTRPILTWMVEYGGVMHSLHKVGDDGRTPRERILGRKIHRTLVAFGEKVLYEVKQSRMKNSGQHLGKMEVKFEDGIYLGLKMRGGSPNTTYLIGKENGDVVESNTIKPKPEGEQWDADMVRRVIGTPWNPEPSKSDEERRQDEADEEAEHQLPPLPHDEEEDPTSHRAMKITKAILKKHGLTAGCEGCKAFRLGARARLHSEACRVRIENAVMAESEAERLRVEEMRKKRTYQPSEAAPASRKERRRQQAAQGDQDGDDGLGSRAQKRKAADDTEGGASGSGTRPPTAAEFVTQYLSKRTDGDNAMSDLMEQAEVQFGRISAEMRKDIEREANGKLKQIGDGQQAKRARTCEQPARQGEDEESQPPPEQLATGEGDGGQMSPVTILAEPGGVAKTKAKRYYDEELGDLKRLEFEDLMHTHETLEGLRPDVTDIYSRPRVTKEAWKLYLRPGFALDLTVQNEQGEYWDFLREDHRRRAREMVRRLRPWLLIGSPPHTVGGIAQMPNARNMDPAAVERLVVEANTHLLFCLELYKVQVEEGRLYLHEHPDRALCWHPPDMEEFLKMPGHERVLSRACRLGAQVRDRAGKGLVLRPTYWHTNSPRIAHELCTRCSDLNESFDEAHRHARPLGGRAEDCVVYPPKLCRAILRGLAHELRDRRLIPRRGLGLANDDSGEAQGTEMLMAMHEYDLWHPEAGQHRLVRGQGDQLEHPHRVSPDENYDGDLGGSGFDMDEPEDVPEDGRVLEFRDNWIRNKKLAHKTLSSRWVGETYHQRSDGSWLRSDHRTPRLALETPTHLEADTIWSGNRITVYARNKDQEEQEDFNLEKYYEGRSSLMTCRAKPWTTPVW